MAGGVAVVVAVISSWTMEGAVRDKEGRVKGGGIGITMIGPVVAVLGVEMCCVDVSTSGLMVDDVTAISITATGGGGGVGVRPSNDRRVSCT